MPTTLPLRVVSNSDDGLASFCRVLLRFYGAIALMLLSFTAIEMQLGMYPGLTAAESLLKASGMDLFVHEPAGALP
jgi:hypothetical protein